MEKNSKNKQKGEESEFLILGGSENEERKYRGNIAENKEANERIEKWKERNRAKLGKIANLAFSLEGA